MARIGGHLVALAMAWNFYANALGLQQSILGLIHLRHMLMVSPHETKAAICPHDKLKSLHLYWREEGDWQNICASQTKNSSLPRYWRIEAVLNYQMLFLSELPITFAIVMKH